VLSYPVSVAMIFAQDLLLHISFIHKQELFEFDVVLHYDILANLYEVSGISEQFCKPREVLESPGSSLPR
jgi:hypothetical protein